jgi:hypothetical protein
MRQAMLFYDDAEKLRPPGIDDAILRWNSCVRRCERIQLEPEPEELFRRSSAAIEVRQCR